MFNIMKATQLNKMIIYAEKHLYIQNIITNEDYNIPSCMPLPMKPVNNYDPLYKKIYD
ncbi:hypothetical protein ACJIZ3_011171 [Penstemon smallii]|uniref:Uncharacterized protein n=1 Tax=Penstemon smallii TaxID=265156 RepID=A0ABD3UID6_9LAMI